MKVNAPHRTVVFFEAVNQCSHTVVPQLNGRRMQRNEDPRPFGVKRYAFCAGRFRLELGEHRGRGGGHAGLLFEGSLSSNACDAPNRCTKDCQTPPTVLCFTKRSERNGRRLQASHNSYSCSQARRPKFHMPSFAGAGSSRDWHVTIAHQNNLQPLHLHLHRTTDHAMLTLLTISLGTTWSTRFNNQVTPAMGNTGDLFASLLELVGFHSAETLGLLRTIVVQLPDSASHTRQILHNESR